MTPLWLLATRIGHGQEKAALDEVILDLLLEYGADVSMSDQKGSQVLHYLCKSQRSSNVNLKHGIDNQKSVSKLLSLPDIDVNATNH